MKALKIDVIQRKVKEVNVFRMEEVCFEIANDCEYAICPIKLPTGDFVYVDDEALLKPNIEGCFMIRSFENVLVGNAIVLGCDKSGKPDDVKINKEELRLNVLWGDEETTERYKDMMQETIAKIHYN